MMTEADLPHPRIRSDLSGIERFAIAGRPAA
jgi:hypothetical protein